MPPLLPIHQAQKEFHKQLPGLLPRLYRFALALTRSRSAADDLVQIGCERALSRLSQWSPDSRLDSWMFRIMQTMWLNEMRARKIRERYATDEAAQPSRIHPEDPERRLILIRAEEEILKLPDDLRLVLILACVEGFSYQETADTLSIPLGTVMSRLARARLLLMERLGQYVHDA
jgi:RNA polymerase sigma-70 factor (ECF subfamily)